MPVLTRMVGFLNTSRAEESRAFYADTLGFAFMGDDQFALVFDANGTTIRINKAPAFTPAQGTVLGWEVDDIDAAVRELTAQGVRFEQFNLAFMPQDDSGIWTTPTGDRVAWFKDPDGNVLSVSYHPAQ